MDRFEPSHSMTAWIVQHCRCNSSSYYGLNRNVFSGKRATPVVNLHYFTLKLFFFNVFVRKYYCFTFEICLVVFLDLIDIYTDTKITKIGAFIAKLQAHPVFRAAILNFLRENPELRFGSRHFWIQHTRKPPDANFYASIRKCTPNSHIRPTKRPRQQLGYIADGSQD